jgi:hypothetical protein
VGSVERGGDGAADLVQGGYLIGSQLIEDVALDTLDVAGRGCLQDGKALVGQLGERAASIARTGHPADPAFFFEAVDGM